MPEDPFTHTHTLVVYCPQRLIGKPNPTEGEPPIPYEEDDDRHRFEVQVMDLPLGDERGQYVARQDKDWKCRTPKCGEKTGITVIEVKPVKPGRR